MNCGSQCCIAGYIALNYARSIDGLIDWAGDVYKDAHLVNTPDICAIGLITGLDPNADDFDSPKRVPSELTDLFGYFLFFPWQSDMFYPPWEYDKDDEDQNITEAIKRLEWLLDEKDPFLYNSDEETRDVFLDKYSCTFEFEYID